MSNPDQSPDERAAFIRWLCESFPFSWNEQSAASAWDNNTSAASAWHSAREPLLDAIAELKTRVAPTEAAAMAATVPALGELADSWEHYSADIKKEPEDSGFLYHEGVREGLRMCVQDLRATSAAIAPQAPVAGQPAEPSPADLAPVFHCYFENSHPKYMRDALPSDMNENLRKYGPDHADWLVETGHPRNAAMCMRRATKAIYPTEFFVALAAPKGDSNG